jgi:hypothetical protein
MNASEHDQVRDNLLIEGLVDAISLGEVHTAMAAIHTLKRPLHDAQELTLNMIRELVGEGLFVLGVPCSEKKDPTRFIPWAMPLDAAMARIEDAYVKHFDDRWGWTTMVWMNQTQKGKELAEKLYHADDPKDTENHSH